METENMNRRTFLKSGVRMLLVAGLGVAGYLSTRGRNNLDEDHCVYLNKCGGCKIASACDLPQKKTSLTDIKKS